MGGCRRSERVHPRAPRGGRLGGLWRVNHGPVGTPSLGGRTPVPPTLLAVMRTDSDEGNVDGGLNSEGRQTEDGTR